MINFLHTNIPARILIELGPLKIYWYGFFIVIGMLLAIFIALKLAGYYKIKKDIIIDMAFWLIIFGVIGARLYHVLLEFSYYYEHPAQIIQIWQGGLAIHGAIIAGVIVLYTVAKKNKINFWLLASIIAPGLMIALSLGRWGNYFNQENFGLPTNLPWGIPILPENRILAYFDSQYFHPAFLYESIGNLLIFLVLILAHYLIIKGKKIPFHAVFFTALILYSLLRFGNEYIRIDTTPIIGPLRFPQLISLIIIVVSAVLWSIIGQRLKNIKNYAKLN